MFDFFLGISLFNDQFVQLSKLPFLFPTLFLSLSLNHSVFPKRFGRQIYNWELTSLNKHSSFPSENEAKTHALLCKTIVPCHCVH